MFTDGGAEDDDNDGYKQRHPRADEQSVERPLQQPTALPLPRP